MQVQTSLERMDCRKFTLFFLHTIIRRVASQDFAVKHSVLTSIFRHMFEISLIDGKSILIELPCVCLASYFVKVGLLFLFSPIDT